MNKNKILTIDEVKHVAKLADLPLLEKEAEDFQVKLSETLDYVENLNQIDTARVSPTYQTGHQENKLREDEVRAGLTQEDALKNAKLTKNGFFVVKAIWD
ncbi:Asp-tRNA(Asn)/Glu-tRNA(Gln) amidotransferase subunit GatC [Patescibacteria group bacterium]|nr:Asp-tRNA(Asn)/Glu-tRNA(Gln) amidotransferase subunit GatC [Patescibacteria group bacterium]